MSRRWALRPLLTSLLCASLGVTSCIFSPGTEVAPCTTDCQGPYTPATTPAELIEHLRNAYQTRNFTLFTNLFPANDDEARYQFVLNEPLPNGDPSWGRTEELKIHRRMFQPEVNVPGEVPVDPQLWLTDVTISLTPLSEFAVTTDFNTPEGDLDGSRWKAYRADYHAVVFFDTVTENDYRVDGRAAFVVIEDLTKQSGDDRKFLLYHWEDLGTFLELTSTDSSSWSVIKTLYR
jgi:hypothetical protein